MFSEFDEDGVLLFLLSVGGSGPRRFVDVGSGDGLIASNTANLALNLGFYGLHVDADPELVRRGRRFYAQHRDTTLRPPCAVEAMVTPDNVDDVVGAAGFEGDVDVLSVDIDGNDYWVWEALRCVTPRFVVIEAHPLYELEDWVMPYTAGFDARTAPPGTRIGASPVAMTRLAERLGYRLVGANLHGFNLFYAREDVGPGAAHASPSRTCCAGSARYDRLNTRAIRSSACSTRRTAAAAGRRPPSGGAGLVPEGRPTRRSGTPRVPGAHDARNAVAERAR